MRHRILLALLLWPLCCMAAWAQEEPSALNAKEFARYWRLEAESPDTRLTFLGDTVEIAAPQGVTLWRRRPMSGDLTIEYDACVMDEGREGDRLSDLNCFWMASDPLHPHDIFKRARYRGGNFLRCYTLQTYYAGYGGNYNSTTRFRRYTGDEAAVADSSRRPAIQREYTDTAHLLRPNRWVHIKIETRGHRTCYYVDGERLLDLRDPRPLRHGWFGFRSTKSRTRITRFSVTRHTPSADGICLGWIDDAPQSSQGVTWGLPFNPGELRDDARPRLAQGDRTLPVDFFPLARWDDGSVKWGGFSAVVPPAEEGEPLTLSFDKKRSGAQKEASAPTLSVSESDGRWVVNTGPLEVRLAQPGSRTLWESLALDGENVAGRATVVSRLRRQSTPDSYTVENYEGCIRSLTVERQSPLCAVIKIEGEHRGGHRAILPFVVRLYFYAGCEQIKMVHTFVYDLDCERDFVAALGLRFEVPLREALYNRHVAFSAADGGVWSEPVQPLVGRRSLSAARRTPGEPPCDFEELQLRGERIPAADQFDDKGRQLLSEWAAWDDYRLTQLTDNSFAVHKRTQAASAWIGTFTSTRSSGCAFLGDVSGGLAVALNDFWQSCPTAMEVNGARSSLGQLTLWLWSPQAEPMDLRHYDTIPHGLDAAYEDVQPGMSTPQGIARTHTLQLLPQRGYGGKHSFALTARRLTADYRLAATPQYLHDKRAFGVWSLPDGSTPFRRSVEQRLSDYFDYYERAVEEHKWYGFWNYGDVMHAYDAARHCWRYDVGGYAWDNTELGTNMWLWYHFLRTGDARAWRMAAAMTRHTGEVDVYHAGPHRGLGSRHNVSHWGCGAKEARISQAAWNRFYYYLTADERCGELMDEVADADTLLYTLDPMRLAQPRGLYPCTAPARLRIGPDWLAYAGNWMTRWERTGDTAYRDKIIAGMRSIAALPHGLFTGPKALGYDPATGIVSYEGDTAVQNTNHLLPLMGGFELMNEMNEAVDCPQWRTAWLDHATRYRAQVRALSGSRFPIPRLAAYAAYHHRDAALRRDAWRQLLGDRGDTVPPLAVQTLLPPEVPAPLHEQPTLSTNGVATWCLDAIYLLEVSPCDE